MRPEKNRRPVAVILGTRPEIIKLSPVIRLLQQSGRPYFLIHTGQHYSYDMDQVFFRDLELPEPKYRFTRPSKLGANQHGELVRHMGAQIEEALKREGPSAVLVQGDTDTVLAGALAAANVGGITIGHVEAGLRSYDNEMPEERNRVEADKLSHILFAPTESARQNLIKENLGHKRIEVTGNTIVDALMQNLEIAESRAMAPKKGYALVTLHRPETVDNKERFVGVLDALKKLTQKTSINAVILPLHPRTKLRMNEHGIKPEGTGPGRIRFVDPPMHFLEFISHEKNADIILTDSGGVQEEACILKVPCVTIRTSTERPETVAAGANVVAGYEPEEIVSKALGMLEKPRNWPNPFGDGKASERILDILEREEVHA